MRELTKTLTSFWWAASMLPFEQLSSMSGAAEISATVQSVRQAGDTLQRGLVDLVFGALRLDAVDPLSWRGSR